MNHVKMLTKNEVKQISWHYFNQRKRSPFFNWISIEVLVNKKVALTDLNSNSDTWMTIDGWQSCPEEKFQHTREWVVQKINKEPDFLLKIINAYKKGHDEALLVWNKIHSLDWHDKSNQELLNAFDEYLESRARIDPWLNLPLLIEADMENELKEKLNTLFPSDPEAYSVLTAPIYPSTQAEETKERNEVKTPEDLKEHWQKWRWLSDTLMFFDYLPIEHFKEKEVAVDIPRDKFDQYYQKITDKSVITLIDTIQKSIWFRSFRIESFYYSSYIILNLLEEIAQRIGVKIQDLVLFIPSEITKFLIESNKPSSGEINNRKYGYIQYWEPNNFLMIAGHEIDKWIEGIKPGYIAENHKELSGNSAFPGLMKGNVVVIKEVNELPNLLKNENKESILVTHMTNPQYVPYLRNISAIVTDEGGILCHAAIISREMKIPCIIGTKTATKILEDGDIVEVDANKGTVKVLERAK